MSEQVHGVAVANQPRLVRDVVVAVDGSEASLEGVRLAADIGRRIGAHVTAVHVRHLPALGTGLAAGAAIEALDAEQQEAYEQAKSVLNEGPANWRFVVRDGSPGHEIVEAAKELHADLIIVGSTPHSALHNAVVGSTAEHLVAHSPVPVLVAR